MTPNNTFKQLLRQQGITLKDWALRHGYSPKSASRVLNGQIKGYYGQAHEIAVAMGLKPATVAQQE